MKNVLEDRTIVVVGSWNLAILNPEWLTRNVFEAEGAMMQIIISSGQPLLRYQHLSVLVSPQHDRVVFSCEDNSDECASRAETFANRLLEKLPVTPVTALGINFGFTEERVPENVAAIFNTYDVAALAEKNLEIREMSLVRHLSFEDRELRLRLTITPENALKVHLNFHKGVSSADDARNAIKAKTALYKQESLDLLRGIYELELEESE